MLYLLGFLLKQNVQKVSCGSIICNPLFSISLSLFEFLFHILMYNSLPRCYSMTIFFFMKIFY